MNILIIHGTQRHGSTYNMATSLLEKLKPTSVTQFLLPKDMPHFCVGCGNCFHKGEDFCPHFPSMQPIVEAMEKADVLIMTTPVYVFHASGQMKAFLDHLGYQFMAHRPNKTMFSKVGVVLSTAAGGGANSAMKDIKTSMTFWGVGSILSYGKVVQADNWNDVSGKRKQQISAKLNALSNKIKRKLNSTRPSLTVKILFNFLRLNQKNQGTTSIDKLHWEKEGWLSGKKPW